MALWGDLVLGQVTPTNRRGKGQGYFRYYRPDGTFEAIVAVNGKLMRNGGDLAITGLPDGFQKDRMVEAVQYGDKLFIATGTKLVEYNGVTASVVTPYSPIPMEALYVGLNGLADNPNLLLTDGNATNLEISGVTVDKQKGIVNTESTFTAYINAPVGMTVEYKWQYRRKDADTFLPTDATFGTGNKTFKFKPTELVDYELRVYAKQQGQADNTAVFYSIPHYAVTSYNENQVEDYSGIHTCNRIIKHWDRLILYGDTVNKNLIHISHLQNPRYFPLNNTLAFDTDKQEPLVKLVQYRDFIVAFLPSSIQALYGTNPKEYRRVRLHTGLGCVAPETPQVFGNHIAFLAKDGVYILKSFGNSESRINVEKIDLKIANLIPPYVENEDACAVVFDDQYQICFPKEKKRYRFYRQLGYWTMDESPYFDFCRFYEWNGDLVVQRQSSGEVFQFDDDVWQDIDHVYEDYIETKSYDFGLPYNPKKAKEVQVLIGLNKYDTNLSVDVWGDSGQILNTEESFASIENGEVIWNTKYVPNIRSQSGTVFGEWNLGVDGFGEVKTKIHKLRLKGGRKYRTVRVGIRHQEAKPYSLLGLGFIFKVKKP